MRVRGRLFAAGVDQLLAVDNVFCSADWQPNSSRTTWVLADQQGTVRDLIERLGADQYTHEHIDYNAFGVPDNLSGLASDVRAFRAGREYDFHTDLYNNRARWYDAAMQRFISEDPIGFAAGDPNLYRYCGNSPVNATDPSGCVSMGEVADWMCGSDGWLFDIDTRATSFFDAHPDAAEWMAARSDAAIYSAAVVASVPLGIGIFYGAPYLAAAAVAAGHGGSLVAAPAFAAAGSGLATFGGWSSSGYVAASWTCALDMGTTSAFLGGTYAHASGATPWQTAGAAYTWGRNGFAGGLVAGPVFHGAGLLVGRGWRYGRSFFGATSDDAARAAARRGFTLPGGGPRHANFSQSSKVLAEAVDVAQSPAFIARARRLGFTDSQLTDLADRLVAYGGRAGEIPVGGFANSDVFLVGRRGLITTRWQRVAHEVGHVLDDVANPGLLQRAEQAGFGFGGYYHAESVAYSLQYGFNPVPITALTAGAESHPIVTTAIVGGAFFGGYEGSSYIFGLRR